MNLTGVIMRSHTSLHSRRRTRMTLMRLDRFRTSVQTKSKRMKKRIELHRLPVDRHPVVSCSKSNEKSAGERGEHALFFWEMVTTWKDISEVEDMSQASRMW